MSKDFKNIHQALAAELIKSDIDYRKNYDIPKEHSSATKSNNNYVALDKYFAPLLDAFNTKKNLLIDISQNLKYQAKNKEIDIIISKLNDIKNIFCNIAAPILLDLGMNSEEIIEQFLKPQEIQESIGFFDQSPTGTYTNFLEQKNNNLFYAISNFIKIQKDIANYSSLHFNKNLKVKEIRQKVNNFTYDKKINDYASWSKLKQLQVDITQVLKYNDEVLHNDIAKPHITKDILLLLEQLRIISNQLDSKVSKIQSFRYELLFWLANLLGPDKYADIKTGVKLFNSQRKLFSLKDYEFLNIKPTLTVNNLTTSPRSADMSTLATTSSRSADMSTLATTSPRSIDMSTLATTSPRSADMSTLATTSPRSIDMSTLATTSPRSADISTLVTTSPRSADMSIIAPIKIYSLEKSNKQLKISNMQNFIHEPINNSSILKSINNKSYTVSNLDKSSYKYNENSTIDNSQYSSASHISEIKLKKSNVEKFIHRKDNIPKSLQR